MLLTHKPFALYLYNYFYFFPIHTWSPQIDGKYGNTILLMVFSRTLQRLER